MRMEMAYARALVVGSAAALAVAALVAPVQAAKPKPTPRPKTPPQPKCVAHAVSYEVSGTLTAVGSITANSDRSYNGSLTLLVTRADKHAKADKGATKTYPRDHARVSFGREVDRSAPAANSRANLKGTITTEPKKCSGFTPTVTIKKVELHAAKPHPSK